MNVRGFLASTAFLTASTSSYQICYFLLSPALPLPLPSLSPLILSTLSSFFYLLLFLREHHGTSRDPHLPPLAITLERRAHRTRSPSVTEFVVSHKCNGSFKGAEGDGGEKEGEVVDRWCGRGGGRRRGEGEEGRGGRFLRRISIRYWRT